MQDSDDYFDDLEIDDAVIAVVEAEESKYFASQASGLHRDPPSASPPPPKRQKTHHGWNSVDDSPLGGSQGIPDIPMDEDAAESLALPGSRYGPNATLGAGETYNNATGTYSSMRVPSKPSSTVLNNNRTSVSSSRPPTVSGSPFSRPAAARHATTAAPPSRPTAPRRSSAHVQTQRPYNNVEVSRGAPVSTSGPAPSKPRPPPSRHPPIERYNSSRDVVSHSRGETTDRALESELEALRLQIAELSKERDEAQRLAKEAEIRANEAQDVRYAKEGEVSILRKGIEKTAQETAKAIAKMKAAKEAAEAIQQQTERNMKEEMERLKTQFTFKQHELETSLRNKPPWSARSKKIARSGQSSPPHSSQISGQKMGPSFILKTPARSRFAPTQEGSLVSHQKERTNPRSQKDVPPLPGFYNAFETSTPVKASQRRQGRGKARDSGALGRVSSKHDIFMQDVEHLDDGQPFSSPPTSPIQERIAARAGKRTESTNSVSSQKNNRALDAQDELLQYRETQIIDIPDEFEEIEPLDWIAEMQRLILGHTLYPSMIPTLQVLLNHNFMSSPPELSEAYVDACARLLNIIGTIKLEADAGALLVETAARSMTVMAQVLAAADSVHPLSALFSLMQRLVYCVEDFTVAILSNLSSGCPQILDIIRCVIPKHLAPGSGDMSEDVRVLALETFGLLRVLARFIPVNLAPRLAPFLRSCNVLSTLVDSRQPTWFVYEAVCCMTLFATHESLFRHILSFPESEGEEMDEAEKDYGRIPHIEQLASHLIDRSREGPEAIEMQEMILVLVSTLANAHPDAITILLQSQTIIPAIVLYLTNLTEPLWQYDEELFSSPEKVTYNCLTAYRIVALLHMLIVESQSSTFNLYQKLVRAPHESYVCVDAMFVATMSRIGLCDLPERVPEKDRLHVDNAVGMAQTLLSLVLDGPGINLCWQAFNVDDARDEDNEEEQEALILHLEDNSD